MEKDFTQAQSAEKTVYPLEGINLVGSAPVEINPESAEKPVADAASSQADDQGGVVQTASIQSTEEYPVEAVSLGVGFPLESENLEEDPWSAILAQKVNHQPADVL